MKTELPGFHPALSDLVGLSGGVMLLDEALSGNGEKAQSAECYQV